MIARWFTNVDTWLQGWPNAALTITLLLAAVILVLIALRGSNIVKALAVAYVFLP